MSDIQDKSPTIKINLYRKCSTPNLKMSHVKNCWSCILCVRGIDFVSFYDFDICFSNFSNGVVSCVLFFLLFILIFRTEQQNCFNNTREVTPFLS